jgi:hypothetical protein
MSPSRKIFAVFAIVFVLFLAYIIYDISSRTTFPGSKPAKTETSGPASKDSSARVDTLR